MTSTVAENVQGGAIADCGLHPEEQPEELVRRLVAFWRSNEQ
jgi:hypothetical protein